MFHVDSWQRTWNANRHKKLLSDSREFKSFSPSSALAPKTPQVDLAHTSVAVFIYSSAICRRYFPKNSFLVIASVTDNHNSKMKINEGWGKWKCFALWKTSINLLLLQKFLCEKLFRIDFPGFSHSVQPCSAMGRYGFEYIFKPLSGWARRRHCKFSQDL